VRRDEYWIAALAIAQLGIAIGVCGIALAGGDAMGELIGANGWPSFSLPAICVLCGAVIIGAAGGALVVGRGRLRGGEGPHAAPSAAGGSETDGAYKLAEDAELKRLAAAPVGDPFQELLRPVVRLHAVEGVAFSTREGLTLSARIPEALDADELSALAPQLLTGKPDWLLGGDGAGLEEEVSVRHGDRSLVVIARGRILLFAMVDERAGQNGVVRNWLHATAAAGARLWAERYGTPP
jgi:predicted regulator of Ras-like GTPase activity (Roadblock/LC7/MglB family)